MGKKGKKKSQGEKPAGQPAAPPQEHQPSSSRESSQPPADQPKKGKKGEQPGQPSQGTQPGTSKETWGPQGDQPGKGKKGPPQEQQSQKKQDDGSGPPQEQRKKGAKASKKGQDRPEDAAPQQQKGGQPPQQKGPPGQQQPGPPGQQQPQAWRQQPPQQQHPQGPPVQQQPPQPQQQRAPAWGAQQPGLPQPQESWRQPQQAAPPGLTQQQPWGAPQVQPAGQPGFLQTPRPQGPPLQRPQQAPPPSQQPAPPPSQQPAPPPTQQQARGPPSQRGAGRDQPRPQQPQSPPGQQSGPSFQGPPPTQQPAKGPPPQKSGGKGQPRQQQQQPAPGQRPSVESVAASLSEVQIREQRDRGDAGLVSKTNIKPGTKGRIIKVESNHLDLKLGNLKTAYHYDVNIVPDRPKKYMRPVIESFRRTHFPQRWPAFDGKKNLYTSSPLTNNLNDYFEEQVSITEEDGREKTFQVEIKFANKVDMTPLQNLLHSPVTPQEALQVVDIVLRMAPVVSCFPVGRSFFVKPETIIDLGQGMEMYHGFYQSAIRGWKPLLNVDVAHKAFPKDINVVDALLDLLNTGRQPFRREDLRSLDRYQEETLLNFIKTLRVNYQIPNHPESRKGYRVNGLGESAERAKFMHENRQITVVEYFNRHKNYRIKYPQLPTLWVGNPQRADKILLPMELCVICEGQALPRKMTDLQTSKMIRHAATDTATRKRKIMQGISRSRYNDNQCVREFGFSVGNEFQKLDARVLKPPDLQYANNRTVRVNRGIWRNDVFLNGVTINKWTIVNTDRYPPKPDDYRKMTDLFKRSGRDCGMVFTSDATEPFQNIPSRYRDIEQYFQSQKGKYDVIFVIVPESGPQYSYVKKAAEIAVGCLTQCIKSNTVARKMNQQTAVNILLKVNSKLNGINHTFSPSTKPAILKGPVMIMGADVTHPGPDARDSPSVAAITASHDTKAFQYNICWRLQNPKVEIIEDLKAIVLEHLKFYYKKTRMKPEAIVFFRDGVSEGQFEQVKNAEIRAIRSACKEVQKEGYEPKITFLVVQKRHHTRLFPMDPKDSEDKNCNVPAGTCVDRDITHPFMQDFYLVSHASIQGVAKPTKYCTLWDDNNMDNDTVEELAYYLCHMFSRCNRSVSYPAPTYYAHLAAARAKVYIENDRLNMTKLQQEFANYQIKDEIRKDLPMFFV